MAARANQARWELTAEDLSADLARSVELGAVSTEQMSERTGMAVASILDTLFREKVTDPDNPRTYMCRPAFRIGSTPYWSPQQASKAQHAAQSARQTTGRGPVLPMIDEELAHTVVSVRDMARLTGIHEQTVRRWVSGTYTSEAAGEFPKATHRRRPRRRHGNPETVYPRAAALQWVRDAGLMPEDADTEADLTAVS